jgi:simple sugar transport system ATP-binding protein
MDSSIATPPLLEMRGITVRYGPVLANDQVDLTVSRGGVVALLGENGAGKTTLMKALVGLVRPQAGEVRLAGRRVAITSPVQAMQLGIGMVHQHFMLIPTLTVVQNVCIGLRRAGYPFPKLRQAADEILALAAQYKLQVDPEARVDRLSVGEQQRVEIVKALYRGAELLVLDEPTAVLTPQESEGLFEVIRLLAGQGKAVVFISHKLNEVIAVSQQVVVLRQGRVVAERNSAETDAQELARLMVGRDVHLPQIQLLAAGGWRLAQSRTPASSLQRVPLAAASSQKPQAASNQPPHPPLLEVHGLRYVDGRGVEMLQGIDLTIRPGEIHGIAGVDGNGQTELAHLLAGLLSPSAGRITLDGQEITHAGPAQRIAAGIGHIPADRQHVGLVLALPLADNCVLPVSAQPPFARWGVVNHRQVRRFAQALVAAYDIRCNSIGQPAGTLSGGNQQKVILARELSRRPRLILANQPTRGLDVGAVETIYAMLLEQRHQGCAILLIATDLDEILTLSDRISVLYEGRLMGTVERSQANREQLGLMMAGKSP